MNENNNGGVRLRRREWLLAAAGPALLAACGGGDPAGPATAASAPMLAAIPMADLPPGELSLAYFTYLQLSAGKALNGLQALRLTGAVSGDSGRAAVLDQLIASRSALLASLHAFTAAVQPVFAGTAASVVLAPASATTRAMVLDRFGLAAMDVMIGSYLAVVAGGNTPQSAGANRPMAAISMSALTNILRGEKNAIALDNAILSQPLTPVQTALAVAGGVVAIAAIGVVLAGSAIPAAVAGGVWAASATIGTVVGGMALFTGLVNAAASTYGVFDAASPADRAAQWQGVFDGAGQVGQGLLDGVAATARPASFAGQLLGFGNNAVKNWELEKANAQKLAQSLQQAAASTAEADAVTPVDVSAPNLPGSPAAPSTASLGADGARVQAPLDAAGQGRMLVPASVAANPGAMCVNDPLDATLKAANDIDPGAVRRGASITVDAAGCGFAGDYTGQFAGQDFGPVSATLTQAGGVTASGSSQQFGNTITATGTVGVTGTFLAIAGSTQGGATFGGKLRSSAIGWSVTGTWSNTRTGLSGTFTLLRRACS